MSHKCISDNPVVDCVVIRGGSVTYLCGFAMSTGGCKYEMCPQSSPKNCADCGYLEEVEKSRYGKCEWSPNIKRLRGVDRI